ncbi:alpha/beta hydrolase [Streptomyces sp. NBC_00670]|uniref:alpha/beta hydrolase n=1 Tax=Streptomyces sp. NBC_00670 TaxID=2975804 RepID=UPI002E370F04|nr:alpha/beta hydrolase [Streptomyces sp. NBC_00670]
MTTHHPRRHPWSRPWHRARHRLRRATLTALLTTALVAPLSAAARPHTPAPAPATLPPLTAATTAATYAANRANAATAARMAEAHGDRHRAADDRALASPSRHLLTFDGRDSGRAVEVFGNLARADRVAVLVPGSDTTLDTYDRFRATALALRDRLPRSRTAVVAWLGYAAPRTFSTTTLTTTRADEGAGQLRTFIRTLHTVAAGRTPHVSLLCHSYGTVVCARAAGHVDADDIALVGSPGTGADSVADLGTRARVWAARGADDWIAHVPHLRADLFGTTVGFGTDPVSPEFGARVFAAGDGGHSDYFRPGSTSLDNLAHIVLGETTEVSRG